MLTTPALTFIRLMKQGRTLESLNAQEWTELDPDGRLAELMAEQFTESEEERAYTALLCLYWDYQNAKLRNDPEIWRLEKAAEWLTGWMRKRHPDGWVAPRCRSRQEERQHA